MKLLLILGSAIALPSFAAGGGDLDIGDSVGVSFWLVTAAMLAATVFFFVERDQVSSKWKTSLTVSGFNHWYCILALSLYERCLD